MGLGEPDLERYPDGLHRTISGSKHPMPGCANKGEIPGAYL